MRRGGDTPSQTLWKFRNENYFLAGRLSEGEPGEIMADVYATNQGGTSSPLRFGESGNTLGFVTGSLTTLFQNIKTAIENTFRINISEVSMALGVVDLGETVPDWETYELVS